MSPVSTDSELHVPVEEEEGGVADEQMEGREGASEFELERMRESPVTEGNLSVTGGNMSAQDAKTGEGEGESYMYLN